MRMVPAPQQPTAARREEGVKPARRRRGGEGRGEEEKEKEQEEEKKSWRVERGIPECKEEGRKGRNRTKKKRERKKEGGRTSRR